MIEEQQACWWAMKFQVLMTNNIMNIFQKTNDTKYFELFFPQKIMLEYKHGNFRPVKRALYPGYAFVKAKKNDLTKFLNLKVRGFRNFLRRGNEIVPLKDHEIDWVITATDQEGVIGISQGLYKNKFIEIISGPLKGKEAQIISYSKRKKRAKLEVTLGTKKLNLDLACLIN
jgi:transcriptional antiterminator NusG